MLLLIGLLGAAWYTVFVFLQPDALIRRWAPVSFLVALVAFGLLRSALRPAAAPAVANLPNYLAHRRKWRSIGFLAFAVSMLGNLALRRLGGDREWAQFVVGAGALICFTCLFVGAFRPSKPSDVTE